MPFAQFTKKDYGTFTRRRFHPLSGLYAHQFDMGVPLFIVAFWLILFLSPIPRTDISNLLGGVFLFLILLFAYIFISFSKNIFFVILNFALFVFIVIL